MTKKKILLVEDELQLIDMYLKKFKYEGFEVEIAEDGPKALKILENYEPDMILLDIMMPYMSGIEVLKKIRENKKTKDLLVTMLTNLSGQSTAEDIYKLGATEYIVKTDMTPLEVVEKVKEILKIYKRK